MNAVERTIRVIEHLATTPGRPTHAQLARDLQIAPSTLSDLLRRLLATRWIEAHGEGYAVGPAALVFAGRLIRSSDLVILARPTLERLAHQTGESALLVTPGGEPGTVRVAAIQEGTHALRYVGIVGDTVPAARSVSGLALTAFSQTRLAELRKVVATRRRLRPEGGMAAWEQRIEAVRRVGYAESFAESEPDFYAISAPVLGPDGTTIAAITLAGPQQRMKAVSSRLAGAVLAAAKGMSFEQAD